MGQYYNALMIKDGEMKAYDRLLDGGFTPAKLTEHSWWLNGFVNTIAGMLLDNPMQVAWVGDYAKSVGMNHDLYEFVWGDEAVVDGVKSKSFLLDGMYLVNHTKKEFLDCSRYKIASRVHEDEIIHPLPILTAIGNGQGGGDYHGTDMDFVGSWALDEIEVRDESPTEYKELVIRFIQGQ